jgi:RHH-type proline utilization regulon transcriptional repressor/proline dehydrogenase/delta 1-pyrroline-5-carboxylate dehydrogenase
MSLTVSKSNTAQVSTKGVRGAKTLSDDCVELVHQWLERAATLHKKPHASSQRLADLLKDPDGPAFALGFVDRVLRPEDLTVAARALRELGQKPPAFLTGILRWLLMVGSWFAPLLPAIVVPIARKALKTLIGHLIIDASDASLERTLKRLTKRGDQLNINLLGEAVLGAGEATKRLEGIERLIERPDVTYVSVKVSSVVAQLSMWSYDQTVERVVEKLVPLYEKAAATNPPTFINLDMEEYRDLEMTLDVFQRVLGRESLHHYYGGIVMQAYLPEALDAMKRLSAFATERVAKGGAQLKVRVVKGANLQMEQVDAALHDWPVAVLPSKQESDTNYKRVLEWSLSPERAKAIRIGVAGHNLFDLAFSHLLATSRGVREHVDFEMLVGMAPDQADAVRETVGPLILYTPVVHSHEFDAAVGYLVRRLDENASPENFMSAVFDLHDHSDVFAREEARFRASLDAMTQKAPTPSRTQDRTLETRPRTLPAVDEFHNEPDTDLALPANQEWARGIYRHAASLEGQAAGLDTLQGGLISDDLGPIDGRIEIDSIVEKMRRGGKKWAARGAEGRGKILLKAAAELGVRRGEIMSVMMQEAGKTLAESDPEISEAIDFARYYASQAVEMEQLNGAKFTPVGLTMVAPPWNFPVAIPTGSVTSALAAGSAVIIKPAPQVRRCAAVMVEALWAAGVPKDVLHLADVSEGELGRALISHQGVDRVILTGAFETAALFRSWRADLPVLAETSGKNALVITPSADIDLAVADLVKSAFGHAGQKCSAASLVILVGSVAKSERFWRQLEDAVNTLDVGWPDARPETTMNPIIEPPGAKLRQGLTELGAGEEWLAEPRQLDDTERLWSPGVRLGVRPGSTFHQTEYFGPLLGVITARTLQDAVEYQNSVEYGLTAGIHSLDPDEVSYWLDHVHAGNLYVNRGITGAIVRRQPFGGWKKSSVGPTAKAGGPNYLFGLGSLTSAPVNQDLVGSVEDIAPEFLEVVAAAGETFTPEERESLTHALLSDQHAYSHHYGASVDVSEVGVERNVFRYRPFEAVVRASSLTPLVDVLRVVLAGLRTGSVVHLSSSDSLPDPVMRVLGSPSGNRPALASVHVESELEFVERVRRNPPQRIRLLGGNANVMYVHFDGSPAVAVWDDDVTQSGRVEMLPFVREQAVSITGHRFGAPDPRFLSLPV